MLNVLKMKKWMIMILHCVIMVSYLLGKEKKKEEINWWESRWGELLYLINFSLAASLLMYLPCQGMPCHDFFVLYPGASLSPDSISSVSNGEISSWFLLQLNTEHELLSAAANSKSGLNPATTRTFCFGASYYSMPCIFVVQSVNFHFFSHLFRSRWCSNGSKC